MKLAQVVMQGLQAVLKMKEHGVLVDVPRMAELNLATFAQSSEYEKQLCRVLDWPGFNPRSSQQCAELYYQRLGFPAQYKRGKKNPTTDDEATKKVFGLTEPGPGIYEHDPTSDVDPAVSRIGSLVLMARSATKLASTYYSLKTDEHNRVHPDWKMHGTETGRYSCAAPPMQTYPPGNARSIFVAPEGWKLGYYDLSQIEFRVMIWAAQDPTGMQLLNSGKDIHRETASLIFKTPYDKVEGEQRFQAKFINFGLPYGRGPDSMARQHGMSFAEAQGMYDSHRDRFPVLWDWLKELCRFSAKHKYVENPFHRRRYFIDEAVDVRERATQNMIPQSTAHDLLMQIHVDIDQELPEVFPVVDMHDALLIEQPEDFDDQKILDIFQRERLQGLYTPAKAEIMSNWGEAKR